MQDKEQLFPLTKEVDFAEQGTWKKPTSMKEALLWSVLSPELTVLLLLYYT